LERPWEHGIGLNPTKAGKNFSFRLSFLLTISANTAPAEKTEADADSASASLLRLKFDYDVG
jgi:hypothetical protein